MPFEIFKKDEDANTVRKPRGRRYPQLQDADFLYNAYVVEGKTMGMIASEVGCSEDAVGVAMTRLGIQARTDWRSHATTKPS